MWETSRGREWVSQVVDAMVALHEIDPEGQLRRDIDHMLAGCDQLLDEQGAHAGCSFDSL